MSKTKVTEWCAVCNHMLGEHDVRYELCRECHCTRWRDPEGYSKEEIERIRKREGVSGLLV